MPPLRVGILANHTFEIATHLFVECARRGLRAGFYQAGYDQYRQELLTRSGPLDQFAPDAVLLSLDLDRALPMDGAVAELSGLLAAYRERSAVPVFVHDFLPPANAIGPLVGASAFDQVMELNRALRAAAAALPSVYVIPAAELAARSGLASWRDDRMRYLARVAINPKRFPQLAGLIARCLAALKRPAAKCLVLDLDNTLWGGILGDAGADGILCADTDYPANAYAGFQRAVLALRSRGILLAVASKNDAAAVEEAFSRRADMPLRSEHISDWEVHWGPKPESLQRIAARLNIGLDSLVFLDDNPAEIDLVKMVLPSVRAYLLPARPEQFVEFLAALEDFDQLELSSEDLRRAELYELRKKQTAMAAQATDLESFLRSLKTGLAPEPLSEANRERILQLIKKTNQFNLTTRRHDQAEVARRVAAGSEVWAFRAADVHGQHGIIAVALLDFTGDACGVDTLVMSCRVIGRNLETAILHFLEGRALARGASRIGGEYLPTEKNGPCRDFYPRHGYQAREGGAEWTKDLTESRTPCPEYITITGELTSACSQS